MTHNPDCDVNDINPDGIKKPCNCGLDSLTAQLQEATKAYETVKAWAHCVSSHLETIMARCDDHADGTSDATDLEKFCNEMIGLSNSISLSDVRTLRAQLEEARGDRERLDWLSAASMAGALIIATDVTQCYLSQASVPTYAPTLRQAIDAAMQQKDVLEPKQ